MKRFCLYSQCSHLSLQTFFPQKVNAQKTRYVQIFLKLIMVVR